MRWTLDQKKHHVAAGYCKSRKRARAPEIIPVSVPGAPGMADGRPLSDEPVTLFLPGGIWMCCQPSQLTDVFRALRHADA